MSSFYTRWRRLLSFPFPFSSFDWISKTLSILCPSPPTHDSHQVRTVPVSPFHPRALHSRSPLGPCLSGREPQAI